VSLSISPATGLLQRWVSPGTAATDWPLDAPTVGADFPLAEVSEVMTRVMADGAAVVTLPADLDDHALTVATWNLVSSLMRPVPQYDTGELVYPVEVRTGEGSASHYSATAASGGLHTDGSLLSEPPDFGILLGLSAADQGGETVLVEAGAVYEHLERHHPHLVPVVTSEHPFATEDDSAPRQWGRLLYRTDDGDGTVFARYLRKYLLSGWTLADRPQPELLLETLDTIDAFTAQESNQKAYLLQRGEVLIWRNHLHIHGRTAFTEDRNRRRLVRFYGQQDPQRPAVQAPATTTAPRS